MSGVASVGSLSVEAEARTGEARKIDQPYTSQIKLTAKVNGGRGPLFRQHRSKAAIRTLLPRFKFLSAVPQFPAMPWIDNLNGAQCQKRP